MLPADYFDGRSTRVHPVDLSIVGEELVGVGEKIDFRVPFAQVKVDESLGRASRRLRLQNGAFCEVHDLAGLDTLLLSVSHRDGAVDRLQRHRRFILLSCLACVLLAAMAYKWGLPWAAAEAAHRLPPALSKALSVQALRLLDGSTLQPSKLSEATRRTLSNEFHALRLPEGGTPGSALLFRGSSQLGANAFTLPDGTIIILDDLITVIGEDQQTLAVLAHELGHAHEHHGLQLLLQSSVVGALWSFYIGDISQLLAAAPAVVMQASYSRDLEQQADDYGAALLLYNGMSPGLLADALKKLADSRPDVAGGGYLSSHPATDERLRNLRLRASIATK